jgi:hypothetical protein
MSKNNLLVLASVLFFLAGAVSMIGRQVTLGLMWIALGATFAAIAKKKPDPQ